ncbi:d2c7946d-2e38-4b3d-9b85-9c5bb853d61f [Thermothielavioides terrestris]|uniref:Thymocyte nuclear protein 1 n=1 Tax=Thermothielavioides terrestris TaxID=2587410 RepID=A0A3S4AVX8_9PEZI|nr:d2c7946d-2e38-4b3d-9b85-9c5bb853d61f [Thermothielavioides terrestris]
MPKRKVAPDEEPAAEPARRRSVRLQKPDNGEALTASTTTKPARGAKKNARKEQPEVAPEHAAEGALSSKQTAKPTAAAAAKAKSGTQSGAKDGIAPSTTNRTVGADGEKTYWLMKAEPESRIENGVDVKFSIDDLAARTEPEPWDGIRAYAARNNLRAMKKGDLAFFYHSNCKEPGIVGTMEIVQEHSPDLSAHDPKAPYYDPSSKPSDPKWSVVHVEFRSKFAVPIGLKELRELGQPGQPLENMQMLKQSRLSVSKVSAAEWEFLMGLAEKKAAQ